MDREINPNREFILAITGASGGRYALRVLDALDRAGIQTHVIVSHWGEQVLRDECEVRELSPAGLLGRSTGLVRLHGEGDLGSPLASGSYPVAGMVICPCSSRTLAAVASGAGDNLIARAAHVTLKEARRLILVHREMPISGIDLENMLRVQRAGGIICPASPGFYLKPRSVEDLIDFVAARILDLLQVTHQLSGRWGDTADSSSHTPRPETGR